MEGWGESDEDEKNSILNSHSLPSPIFLKPYNCIFFFLIFDFCPCRNSGCEKIKSLVYETSGYMKDLKALSENDSTLKIEYSKIRKEFDTVVVHFSEVTKASTEKQKRSIFSMRQDTKKMEQQRLVSSFRQKKGVAI